MSRLQQVCSGFNPFKRSSRSRSSSNSTPDTIRVSIPTSQPFNYDAYPIAPWQNDYSTHTPNRLPIPPPKDYSLKYMPLPANASRNVNQHRHQQISCHGNSNVNGNGGGNKHSAAVPRHLGWKPSQERKRSATTSSLGSAYSDTESLLDDYYTATTDVELPSPNRLGLLSPARMWNGGKKLLAKPDLHGDNGFLERYEELTKPDWGEPDEWVYGL